MSGRSWILLGAAVVFAGGGCSSGGPGFLPTTDGPILQFDGGADRSVADTSVADGPATGDDGAVVIPDGGIPDGGLGDGPGNRPPVITIERPGVGEAVKPTLTIKFTITDADDGLAAAVPEVLLEGAALDLGLPAAAAGVKDYSATATHDVAASLAEGAHTLLVRASDQSGATGTAAITFFIDRTGPVLTPVAPLAWEMVGGTTHLQVQVTDDHSAVDPASVKVELDLATGGTALDLFLESSSGSGGTFGRYFDTNQLPTSMINPQLLWRAKDMLGNESNTTLQFSVDNTPPRVALVSPTIFPAKSVACLKMCGNGQCEDTLGETVDSCPVDCGGTPSCGDGVCDIAENGTTCPADCAAICGNGRCDSGLNETVKNCPADCHACGDSVCSFPLENCHTCPADCGQCRIAPCSADKTVLQCGHAMDPLMNFVHAFAAPGTPNPEPARLVHLQDGEMIPQAMFMRTRVEDRGNFVTGMEIPPIALTDQSRVRLYILPDRIKVGAQWQPTPPLVASVGGICTGVNEPPLREVGAVGLLNDPDNVLVLDLAPVPVAGDGDYRDWVGAEHPAQCGALGDSSVTASSEPLCKDLSDEVQAPYVMRHPFVSPSLKEPAVYSIPPITAGSPLCEGDHFDAATGIPDGWFCAAVVAYDRVGNIGVSKPLHVCLNRDWIRKDLSACATPPTKSCVVDPDPAYGNACEIPAPFTNDTIDQRFVRTDK
ncbi:MAG TPA: hypothetical protein VGQ83_01855 [Polyangia bacterium]|jgi:hypothetical protein